MWMNPILYPSVAYCKIVSCITICFSCHDVKQFCLLMFIFSLETQKPHFIKYFTCVTAIHYGGTESAKHKNKNLQPWSADTAFRNKSLLSWGADTTIRCKNWQFWSAKHKNKKTTQETKMSWGANAASKLRKYVSFGISLGSGRLEERLPSCKIWSSDMFY